MLTANEDCVYKVAELLRNGPCGQYYVPHGSYCTLAHVCVIVLHMEKMKIFMQR